MQLKRQSEEAWRNEKHYSKGNNTSENPTPRRETFKSVSHVKYEGQVRSQHLLFVQFSTWAFMQAVVLLTKTAINHRFFFNQVWGEWMDLRNSNGFELRNSYFTTV